MRNQRATAAAPMQPAMKPSRRMRFKSIAREYIAGTRACSIRPPLPAPGETNGRDAAAAILRTVCAALRIAVRDRGHQGPAAPRRWRGAGAHARGDERVAPDPLVA